MNFADFVVLVPVILGCAFALKGCLKRKCCCGDCTQCKGCRK